jgi:hypothetical protein
VRDVHQHVKPVELLDGGPAQVSQTLLGLVAAVQVVPPVFSIVTDTAKGSPAGTLAGTTCETNVAPDGPAPAATATATLVVVAPNQATPSCTMRHWKS